MLYYELGENEPLEDALKKFRRRVLDTHLLADIRRRQYYLPPTQAKRWKTVENRKRRARARKRARAQNKWP